MSDLLEGMTGGIHAREFYAQADAMANFRIVEGTHG
jgi:hypothetical protein